MSLPGAPATTAADPVEAAGEPLFREAGPPIVIARGDTRVQLTRTDGRWWVTGPDGNRTLADAAGVQRLVAYLDGLATVRPVADFGRPRPDAFADPLTITRGRDAVAVGGPSRIPGLSYARRGDGGLYLIRPVRLDPTDLRLVDRRLFPDGLGAIDEIDVTGPDLALHATRKFGPWRLTAPTPSPADGPAVDRWLAGLAALNGDPAKAGPDPGGAYQVVLTAVDGRTLPLTLARDGRVAVGTLAFQTDSAPGLVPDRFQWMIKEVVRIPGNTITGIQIQQAERTVVITRRGGGTWVAKDTGRVYRTWTGDLFAYLDPLRATGLWGDSPEALGTAQVEVRLWRDRELFATVELWLGADGRWWARGGQDVAVYEIGDALPEHLARVF